MMKKSVLQQQMRMSRAAALHQVNLGKPLSAPARQRHTMPCVYTVYIPCVKPVYTLCIPCVFSVYILCIPCVYQVYTLCMPCVLRAKEKYCIHCKLLTAPHTKHISLRATRQCNVWEYWEDPRWHNGCSNRLSRAHPRKVRHVKRTPKKSQTCKTHTREKSDM